MKKQWNKKIVSYFLCMMIFVMAFTIGCNGNTEQENSPAANQEEQNQAENNTDDNDTEQKDTSAADQKEEDNTSSDITVLGEGETSFSFSVVDKEGSETLFEIHTDKETVGEALLELELIDGDESEYGLYVKTVNGITADYDKDGVYWAFYISDEYAETGVDSTKIVDGNEYSFRMQKA